MSQRHCTHRLIRNICCLCCLTYLSQEYGPCGPQLQPRNFSIDRFRGDMNTRCFWDGRFRVTSLRACTHSTRTLHGSEQISFGPVTNHTSVTKTALMFSPTYVVIYDIRHASLWIHEWSDVAMARSIITINLSDADRICSQLMNAIEWHVSGKDACFCFNLPQPVINCHI